MRARLLSHLDIIVQVGVEVEKEFSKCNEELSVLAPWRM